MTTPRPTPFPATTPRARVFAPFFIIFDSDDEITTLPVRPAPPSPDRTPALYGYLLDSGDDSSDKDLSETAESLHTQTPSTLVVYSPPTRSIPTSPAFSHRLRKDILMPLGYKATMNQWRAKLSSTWYPLLPLELPSLSRKRSRSLSPPLAPSVSPSLPPPTVVPPPLEHIESIRDNIEASIWDLERHLGPYIDILVIYEISLFIIFPCDLKETMSTTNQWMSFTEIKQIVSQRVANAIETIAIYEAKTCVARDSMKRVKQQKDKVAKNASNKRKWEGDHGGSSSQQQNKDHKVVRAYTAGLSNKKGYTGTLPLCNKCKLYHNGS
nr:reverse transcriptase domain-containing protein [Tanacetum cinerariifolium]